MFAARTIRYEMAYRTRAIGYGGIGAVHLLARKVGLVKAIDRDLQLLKVRLPYHESDHVLNIAYNILCDGDCLADLERLCHDEGYLDAWAPAASPIRQRREISARRFESADRVIALMQTINLLVSLSNTKEPLYLLNRPAQPPQPRAGLGT
jgi:hypothetical protein